jgi:hypothetical protein
LGDDRTGASFTEALYDAVQHLLVDGPRRQIEWLRDLKPCGMVGAARNVA